MMTIKAGGPLIRIICLAHQANQPILLHSRHGVGKSEIFEQAANLLAIGHHSADLSILEPVDLTGLPQIGQDGRVHYAVPAFLPNEGRGLLVFEELNRCPKYLQAPCLQLLTARRLNDYHLPLGWLPCACINDADDYNVEELDAALLARFLQVKVLPDVTEWLSWARAHGRIHEQVMDFVQQSPGIFDEPESNPRAWTYVSNILKTWEESERDQNDLATCFAGIVGDKWALAFLQVYTNQRKALTPSEILDAFPAHQAAVKCWVTQGHLDVVIASLELLKRHLQPQRTYEQVIADHKKKGNVEVFFSILPADLKKQLREWLVERGFNQLVVPKSARKKS